MARERCLEMDDEESIPVDAFRRSELQFRFNIDRVIDKYQNLEMNGKSSGIEVGSIYFLDTSNLNGLGRLLLCDH